LAKHKLQFNSGTLFQNSASSGRIFSLNKNKGNKKNVAESGRSEGGHQTKIYQLKVQFGRKTNTRLSALTFFVK